MIPACPSFGLVNGRPLFLDLAADSYFLLEPDGEAELLHRLRIGASDRQPVVGPRPRQEIDTGSRMVRPSLADLVVIGWSLSLIRRRLRRDPLTNIIADLARLDRLDGQQPNLVALALRFHHARRWLPHRANCLSDSLALLAFLERFRASAELVFGAKLDPFAAHCWVQSTGILLNDRLDRIEGFTPVAILGP